MPYATLESAWERIRAKMRPDGRAFILAMVQLPGVDLAPLRDPATVQTVLDAAYASESFPIGPFSYVEAPKQLAKEADHIGGVLLHDEPGSFLEGHFAFAHDGDVAASWAFTRARPGQGCSDILLIDMEAVLVESFVMATTVASVLGHRGPARFIVGVAAGDENRSMSLQALDEDSGEPVVLPSAPDRFTPVRASWEIGVEAQAMRESLYLAATEIARQFGVSSPQFLPPAGQSLPAPLRPGPPGGRDRLTGAA